MQQCQSTEHTLLVYSVTLLITKVPFCCRFHLLLQCSTLLIFNPLIVFHMLK